MSQGFPSMTALLGLLAVAGYQNRDKIAEWLGAGGQSSQSSAPGGPASQPGVQVGSQIGGSQIGGSQGGGSQGGGSQGGGLAGVLQDLGRNLSGATSGGILSGGLRELIERFKQSGQGETAQSGVGHGPNRPVAPAELERAIGPDTLDALSQQTGLSRQELLARLSRELPDAVDRYTPDGRLPPA
jgi:uncharacterized protein YidB (DUF937 family)